MNKPSWRSLVSPRSFPQHAYELVTAYGETDPTLRLLPFTVDGLIRAASVVVRDARQHRSLRETRQAHSALAPTSPGPPPVPSLPPLERTVSTLQCDGHRQRAIACQLNIGRRKVELIIDHGVAA